MTISLTPELEAALARHARQQGTTPEALAIETLREKFIASLLNVETQDDWEELILSTGTETGVSLTNEAVSSEGLYE